MTENKTPTITREKILQYIHTSKEFYECKLVTNEWAQEEVLNKLHGFIYSAARETGEITIYVKRPSFLDWLFRRTRVIREPYTIRHLVKIKDLPSGTMPIIQFDNRI